jgi:hypothetical protein
MNAANIESEGVDKVITRFMILLGQLRGTGMR